MLLRAHLVSDFEAFHANLRQEAMAQGTPALIAEAKAQKMPEVQKVLQEQEVR